MATIRFHASPNWGLTPRARAVGTIMVTQRKYRSIADPGWAGEVRQSEMKPSFATSATSSACRLVPVFDSTDLIWLRAVS